MFFPEFFECRSQDLPLSLHDAGQFYCGRPVSWLNHLRMIEDHSYPIMIPHWRIQDIDTRDDWKGAELLFNMLNKKV